MKTFVGGLVVGALWYITLRAFDAPHWAAMIGLFLGMVYIEASERR